MSKQPEHGHVIKIKTKKKPWQKPKDFLIKTSNTFIKS